MDIPAHISQAVVIEDGDALKPSLKKAAHAFVPLVVDLGIRSVEIVHHPCQRRSFRFGLKVIVVAHEAPGDQSDLMLEGELCKQADKNPPVVIVRKDIDLSRSEEHT